MFVVVLGSLYFGSISVSCLVMLAPFYINCSSIDFALTFNELLIMLLNPQPSNTIEKDCKQHVFLKNHISRHALMLHPFGAHFSISWDEFWHYSLNLFGIDLGRGGSGVG